MTSQSEPTTQNGEAMTPQPLPTTAQFVGDVLRAYTEHSMAMERSRDEAATGARNLGFQLRMAHRSMDEGERRIGELNEKVNTLEDLLNEAWGVIANAYGGAWSEADPEWLGAAERWRDRYHETLPSEAQRDLTDETPMDPDDEFGDEDMPVNPTCGAKNHDHSGSSCQGPTPTAPPAG